MSFGKRHQVGCGGVDRRNTVREQTDVMAQIALTTGQPVKCRVTDFSKTGARLAVSSAFGLPEMFELRAGGKTYRVRVIRSTRRSSACHMPQLL
jgi:hypothetical protein